MAPSREDLTNPKAVKEDEKNVASGITKRETKGTCQHPTEE